MPNQNPGGTVVEEEGKPAGNCPFTTFNPSRAQQVVNRNNSLRMTQVIWWSVFIHPIPFSEEMETEYKARMYGVDSRFARKKTRFIDKELLSVDTSPACPGESVHPRGLLHRKFIFHLARVAKSPEPVYICTLLRGTIAQLVEQRIENPRVPGSNPGSTT